MMFTPLFNLDSLRNLDGLVTMFHVEIGGKRPVWTEWDGREGLGMRQSIHASWLSTFRKRGLGLRKHGKAIRLAAWKCPEASMRCMKAGRHDF